MALLNFDASTVEPASGYEPLPAGEYPVIITDSQMRAAKSGNGEYLELEMRVIEGKLEGRRIWERLNIKNSNEQAREIAFRSLSAICRAVGVMNLQDSSELHDKPMQIRVIVKDGFNGPENNIKAYKPLGGSAPAPAPAATAPTQGAPETATPANNKKPWE